MEVCIELCEEVIVGVEVKWVLRSSSSSDYCIVTKNDEEEEERKDGERSDIYTLGEPQPYCNSVEIKRKKRQVLRLMGWIRKLRRYPALTRLRLLQKNQIGKARCVEKSTGEQKSEVKAEDSLLQTNTASAVRSCLEINDEIIEFARESTHLDWEQLSLSRTVWTQVLVRKLLLGLSVLNTDRKKWRYKNSQGIRAWLLLPCHLFPSVIW